MARRAEPARHGVAARAVAKDLMGPIATRRNFLGLTASAALVLAGRLDAAAPGLAEVAPFVSPALLERALQALARHRSTFWSSDCIGIADFSRPSLEPRLHIIELLAGRVTSIRVAHGRGSDPEHSGMLQSFSNVPGSLASSEGAYMTGDPYIGIHGASRRLIGLDPTNDAAESRAIVIHSAWYAAPEVLVKQPVLGRSDGCFAVAPGDIAFLLAKLGKGRLLYAGKA